MKYRDETAFRQALEQRLKDRAGGDGALLVRNRRMGESLTGPDTRDLRVMRPSRHDPLGSIRLYRAK